MATVIVENLDRAEHRSEPGEWVASHAPTSATQAVATQAAPAAGKRNVVRSILAKLCGGATAPAAATATLQLVEDVAGTPTTTASFTMAIAAVAGATDTVQLAGLNVEVTAGKSITLQFSAAPGANTFETVLMTGYVRNVNAPA